MKRAVVTGAARGIGLAIARALRQTGTEVIAIDRSPEGVEGLGQDGFPAYVCDVADFAAVSDCLADVEGRHGPVDILVNNAGIIRDAMVHKMDPISQWQAVIDVNLTSAFNTVRVLVPGMRSRGWGRIINMSSMSGLRGQVGQANYAAAKAGLIGFTKSIALELAGKGICANCIAPGFIESPMTASMPAAILRDEAAHIPAGRLGQPEDIAGTVVFLASDAASFITGQVLSVNGGQYL